MKRLHYYYAFWLALSLMFQASCYDLGRRIERDAHCRALGGEVSANLCVRVTRVQIEQYE